MYGMNKKNDTLRSANEKCYRSKVKIDLNLFKSAYVVSYNTMSVALLTYVSLLCLWFSQNFHTPWIAFFHKKLYRNLNIQAESS